jgi:hypothetical protein
VVPFCKCRETGWRINGRSAPKYHHKSAKHNNTTGVGEQMKDLRSEQQLKDLLYKERVLIHNLILDAHEKFPTMGYDSIAKKILLLSEAIESEIKIGSMVNCPD